MKPKLTTAWDALGWALALFLVVSALLGHLIDVIVYGLIMAVSRPRRAKETPPDNVVHLHDHRPRGYRD